MFESFRYNLKNLKNNDEKNFNHKELLSLFNSAISNKANNSDIKLNIITDLLKSDNNNNKNKNKNLLDKFINEKVEINRKSFNKDLSCNSFNFINNIDESRRKLNSSDNKYKDAGTFITRKNYIQKRTLLNNEQKFHSLGKSLNDVFIKNIKNEMINRGILIQKPLSSKVRYTKETPSANNFNNFEFHMKMFKSKVLKEFNKYIKYYESTEKKKLEDISEKLAIKKENMTKKIPIYIKAFKSDGRDVFHSRKIYDVQYQTNYRKPYINLEELIQNQNQYSSKLKKDKIQYYHFLRTVNNPYKNLKVFKKSKNKGQIFLKFNGKENTKNIINKNKI